jgi:hypothetical protein
MLRLPMVGGGDLRTAAGRAVDAAMLLLDGSTLDTPYMHEVSMLGSCRPGGPEPIAVAEPTVGLLVATIIGTLDAIFEKLIESEQGAAGMKTQRRTAGPAGTARLEPAPGMVGGAPLPWSQPPVRGRRVPHI